MKTERLATCFLLLASTMTILASATLAPALPAMTHAFHAIPHAEFWVKMTLTLPGLVIALCAPLAGALVDKLDSRHILMHALLLFSISGFLGFYWQESLWLILMSRALMGLSVAFIMVSCTTIAGHYYTGPSFSKYMGWQSAFGGFGGVVFLSIAGVLADQHWTWVFAIYALALMVWPGVWRFVNAPCISTKLADTDSAVASLNKGAFLGCCALAFIEIMVLYGLTIQLPFYLSDFHASPSTIGFAIAVFLFAMSSVSLCYGRIRRSLSILQVHFLGWFIIALGFVVQSGANSIASIIAASVITGIGLGLIRPNLVVWLFEFVPVSRRGKAMGVIMTCYFTGQFLSPMLLEPISRRVGYPLFFHFVAVTIFAGLTMMACALIVRRVRQGDMV
ncbi:GGDEF [Pseudoalteromonas luteoviolacea B = ATCC 29581]|nr:GGDEF [Pseudoalteromonas luteoviolacea B = ATCC 29581]